MVRVSGPLVNVTTSSASVRDVQVHTKKVRTWGDGLMTPDPSQATLSNGEVEFEAAPGPVVMVLFMAEAGAETVSLVVGEGATQSLADAYRDGQMASDRDAGELAGILEQIRASVGGAAEARAGAEAAAEDAAGSAVSAGRDADRAEAAAGEAATEAAGLAADAVRLEVKEDADRSAAGATTATEKAAEAAGSATRAEEAEAGAVEAEEGAEAGQELSEDAAAVAVAAAVGAAEASSDKADTSYVDAADQALGLRIDGKADASGTFTSRGSLPAGADANAYVNLRDMGAWSISGTGFVNLPPRPSTNPPGGFFVEADGSASVIQRVSWAYTSAIWERSCTNPYTTPARWSEWARVDAVATASAIQSATSEVEDALDSKADKDWVDTTSHQNRGTLADGADLDSLTRTRNNGLWALSAERTYANTPFTGAGQVSVYMSGTGAGYQEATKYQSHKLWRRPLTNAFSTPKKFGPWKEFATVDQIPEMPDLSSIKGFEPPPSLPDPGAPLDTDMTRLTMWGDSLTAYGGVVEKLQAHLPDVTVVNEGLAGQTAPQIAARQGGNPTLVSIDGGVIPASGEVEINRTEALLAETGYPANMLTGWLGGVHGTISNNANSTKYYFRRTADGAEVPLPDETPFWPDTAIAARRGAQIIWAGRNNFMTRDPAPAAQRMVDFLTPARKRVVVLSVTNTPQETRGTERYNRLMDINRQMRVMFGDNFLDVRRWLIEDAMGVMGYTPTAEDTAAIEGDAVPPRLTTDGVHFTGSVQRAIGTWIYDQLVARGWYSSPRTLSGTGFPEGKIAAPVGSTYADTDATGGAIRWIKASGTDAAGWVVESGDTGPRDVTSLIGGITSGRVLYQRKNGRVSLVFDAVEGDGSATFTIPGSRSLAEIRLHIFNTTHATPTVQVVARPIYGHGIWFVTGQTVTGEVSWVTNDAWSTTRPGTPI